MHNLWQSHESALQLTVPCRADAEHTERALIQRVLNGDRGAYREFEERYRNLIHAVLHRHHVCAQDHDDIYQELYVRLWAQEQRRLRLWQTTGVGTFKSYLIAVVRNLICDWYRSYPATLIAIGSASPAADAARMTDADPTYFNGKRSIDFDGRLLRNERMNAVREAMTGLRTRDADLIRRRYYAEQSYQDIAEALGMSVNSVGVALFNARVRLGRRLRRSQPDLFVEESEVPAKSQRRAKSPISGSREHQARRECE